jgi:hypothetical protein
MPMKITPSEIIEEIIDGLVVGFDDRSPTIRVSRTGDGTLDLDSGDARHFSLAVVEEAG